MSSKKKKIKHQATHCFLCGQQFVNWEDKTAYRIDKTKNFKPLNMVVLCHECSLKLSKSRINIYEIKIKMEYWLRYARVFGYKTMKAVKYKMNLLKWKKDKADKEKEL